MKIVPKNWHDFQHYKDRSPPWIRLHRKLLDDMHFQRLPVASRALAPMLWLLASESMDGVINADPEELAFRLRQSEEEIVEALKPLIEKGFFVVIEGDASAVLAHCKHVASTVLAPRLQRATPETETETETEITPPVIPPVGGSHAGNREPARKRSSSVQADKPDDVQAETWADWVALRTRKRAPVTATVVSMARREADKAGLSLQRFLEVWCLRGSQGLQADWLRPHERASPLTDSEDRPQWALKAGFANRYEANNEGCFEHNAHQFRDGRRVKEVA